MAILSRSCTLAALAAGMLSQSWAEGMCGDAASSESCRRERDAQDHLLLQVQQGKMSRAEVVNPTSCSFVVPPETPYYWEQTCESGMVGCWADGVHAKCRFCNYEGITCPTNAVWPTMEACDFDNDPVPLNVGYYWEENCEGVGCNADGKHQECRFCGGDDYAEVPCKVDQCTFANEPATPYYFDSSCSMGMLGCLADGMHMGCRYCGRRPFDGISCPASSAVHAAQCWFQNPPGVPSKWEPSCVMGMVGCWADGIHAECRFCGGAPGSSYEGISCD